MKDEDYLKKYLDKDKIEEVLKQLKKGLPVQYIVGSVNFYGIELKVNNNVLIPRFETEYLVEKTINYSKKYLEEPINIIDLGTGSGSIAIALKKNLNSTVDAIDISEKALEIAKENAINNCLNINFFKNDMLKNINGKYDIIISNPPYISKKDKVEDIVKNNEPHIALYAKKNGLEFYESILKDAKNHIKSPGIIAFEIGMTQGEEIKTLTNQYLDNIEISVEKDLTGKDRYVFIFIK